MSRSLRNEFGLIIATFVVIGFTCWRSDSYWESPQENAKTILREWAFLGVLALGAATVIISGGIDLSAGSVIAFSGTIFGSIVVLLVNKTEETHTPITKDLPTWIFMTALTGTMLAALMIGTFHTWLIAVVRLPPFVATLASLVGLRSLAKLLIQDVTRIAYESGGKSSIGINDAFFKRLGNDWWIPVVTCLGLAFLLYLLLSRTVAGRHLYALGGNEQAAVLSGIRTDRLKWLAYCISSVTASIAGILYASYTGTVDPTRDGFGYELNAIAASVVGGCSLTGGIGSVAGVMLGAMFLKVVIDSVAKSFRSRPDLFEGLVVGVLVVLAVAFNELRGTGWTKKQFFPGVLGWANVFILSLLAGALMYVTKQESDDETMTKAVAAALTGGGLLVLLSARATFELVRAKK